MWKIGLTGSIATGKSTALKCFAALGVKVFSADAAVHALYHGAAVAGVEALFPGATRNGEVDRTALSAQLLAHPEKLKDLEALVHPLVRAEIAKFLAASMSAGEPLAVVDIPLLFESGYDYGLDRVALLIATPEIQHARALARPGMSVEKLAAILARQMPQDEKRLRADYVLNGNGPLETLKIEVAALTQALRATPKDTK